MGPPARSSDKLHAFTGYWYNDYFRPSIVKAGVIPLKPAYEAIRARLEKARQAGETIQGNEPLCIPNGPIMGMNFGIDVSATASRLTVMTSRLPRFIDLNKKHTPEFQLFDTYSGESVAHWDGNTLVVDTIGVKPIVEIDWGIHNSGHLHLIERWRVMSPTKLRIQTTVEDSGALTKPWSFNRYFSRRPAPSAADWTYCVPALDRTRNFATGKQEYNLTPPPGGYIPPGAQQ